MKKSDYLYKLVKVKRSPTAYILSGAKGVVTGLMPGGFEVRFPNDQVSYPPVAHPSAEHEFETFFMPQGSIELVTIDITP